MPAAKKSAPRRAATAATRARAQLDTRQLDRIAKALEAAQKDLASVGGSLGSGARDLRGNIIKTLRDSRRDLGTMRKAVQAEVERIQKELASAARSRSSTARRGAAAARTTAGRASAKRSTTKRATPKRAAAKGATAKRATAKRATASRATAKRATPKRGTQSRATTTSRRSTGRSR